MGQQLTKDSQVVNRAQTRQHPTVQQTRRRSSVDSDILPSYINSDIAKPIGSGVSVNISSRSQSRDHSNNPNRVVIPADIVVVNKGTQGETDCHSVTLPTLYRPLIPIGHESLLPSYPQINWQLFVNLGSIIQEELRTKAEFISKEQHKLSEKIRETDCVVSQTSNSFVNERQRRAIKLRENFSKIDEIGSLIDKCDTDIRKCVRSLDTLNRYLPSDLRLEKLDFKVN